MTPSLRFLVIEFVPCVIRLNVKRNKMHSIIIMTYQIVELNMGVYNSTLNCTI